MTLLDHLLQRCAQVPTAQALVHDEQICHYGELADYIGSASDWLSNKNLKAGDRVIIALENSLEYIVMLYALWAANMVAVPIHAQSRSREINHLRDFTQAKLVVVDSKFKQLDTLQTNGSLEVVQWNNSIWQEITSHPNKVSISATADDLALIIFTSGTTGNPKGVQLSHNNLFANTQAIVEYLSLNAEDEIYNVLPFNYSYGNSVLLTHLYAGACIVVGKSMAFPQQVTNELQRPSLTGFAGVPTTFALLLDKTNIAQQNINLRYITQAGGAMPPTLIQRVQNCFRNAELFIMYGQTEASARLTYLPPSYLNTKLGSAGIAIPGVEIAIMDSEGNLQSANSEGEVLARGENIMLGYWNNDSATAATLKNGWLHTGDYGHLDKDGFLFLKGRKNQIIKSGAHRIHPAEIEEVIAELDMVAQVAAVGRADEQLGEIVSIFIIAKDGADKDTKTVMRYCREQLPLHKQPKQVTWVNEFPTTQSGKIQKHLLL